MNAIPTAPYRHTVVIAPIALITGKPERMRQPKTCTLKTKTEISLSCLLSVLWMGSADMATYLVHASNASAFVWHSGHRVSLANARCTEKVLAAKTIKHQKEAHIQSRRVVSWHMHDIDSKEAQP